MATREPSMLDQRGAVPARRLLSRRLLGHTVGLLVALALAWLILRAYQQPEFLLDLSNMRLC